MHNAANLLRRFQVPLVLGVVTVVHLVATLAWNHLDSYSVFWVPDDFAHTAGLQQLLTSLELGGLGAAVAYLREVSSYYSYLAHYPLAMVALLVGDPHLSLRLANGIYFVVLLISTYHVGRLCHGRSAGLLAAALVSLMPAAYGGWRTFGLDFPAMCLTTLAMLMLMLSRGFRHRAMSIAFGVAAGAAVLAKGQSLLFLFWPAAFVLGRGLVLARATGNGRWKQVVVGALLALASLALSTAVWWAGRLGDFARIMGAHTTGEGMQEYEYDISLWGGITYYATAFPLLTTGLLLLAALALAPLALRHSRQRWILIIWFVVPLVLHMVLKVRHYRYLFPLVPVVSVFLAVGLASLGPRLRSLITLAVSSGAVVLWLSCSFFGRTAPDMREHVPAGGLNQQAGTVPAKDLLTARVGLPGGLASYCLTCGPYRLVAPKPRVSHSPHLVEQGAAIARVLGRRHPAGEQVVLYHTIETINHALELQRRLPGLRLSLSSTCPWAEYRQFLPPPGWAAYVLLTAEHGVPSYVDQVVHSARIWKTLADRRTAEGRAGQGVYLRLVLWGRRPGSGPPPSEPFVCDFLPRVMAARARGGGD